MCYHLGRTKQACETRERNIAEAAALQSTLQREAEEEKVEEDKSAEAGNSTIRASAA